MIPPTLPPSNHWKALYETLMERAQKMAADPSTSILQLREIVETTAVAYRNIKAVEWYQPNANS